MTINENQQKTMSFNLSRLGKNCISAKKIAKIQFFLRKNGISAEKIAEIPIFLRSSEVRFD